MLFALMCTDRAGALDIRMSTRPDHLAFLESLGDDLMFAGPFLGPDDKPSGSLVVVRAPDLAAAEAIAKADPYARAGLFQSVEIKPWRWALKVPEGLTQ